jgi:hypothetical protein
METGLMSEANMPTKVLPAWRRLLAGLFVIPEGQVSTGAGRIQAQEPGERGSISFKDGMLRFLEAAETSYDNAVLSPDPKDQIAWFVSSLFLRGQGDRPLVAVYGVREPSRASRFIPDAEIKHLEWDSEREQLRSILSSEPAVYSGVTLDACQFGKHLDWYLKRLPNRVSAAA